MLLLLQRTFWNWSIKVAQFLFFMAATNSFVLIGDIETHINRQLSLDETFENAVYAE